MAVRRKGRGKPGPPQPLDEKYLGQRLPGNPQQRVEFLKNLVKWLQDPKRGPKWVWENRIRLLSEAEFIVNEIPLSLEELIEKNKKSKAWGEVPSRRPLPCK
jgi:hypothetical protein